MIRRLSFFPSFFLALVLCAAAHAQTAMKVKVFPGAQALSLIAGTSQGIFEKHGLRVEVLFTQNSVELRDDLRSITRSPCWSVRSTTL
jgi:ABC-type nitrate/sulfonate/bicarbonate transport system substrate-binding protein